MRSKILSSLLLAWSLGCSDFAPENGPLSDAATPTLADLSMSCTLEQSLDEPGRVRMILRNHGSASVAVSASSTAWDDSGVVFQVSHDDSDWPYRGIWAYAEDLGAFTISPGSELDRSYDLQETHGLRDGRVYTVAVLSDVFTIEVEGRKLAVRHDCQPLSLNLPADEVQRSKDLTFLYEDESCNFEEQRSADLAERVAASALYSVPTTIVDNDLYRRWFGAPSTERLAFVNAIYQRMRLDWQGFRAVCSTTGMCTDRYSAWVNGWPIAGDHQKITLCSDRFFDYPIFKTGGGAQSMLLIHEKAHAASSAGGFVIRTIPDQTHSVCDDGADNVCYGWSDSRALAIADPEAAVHNAENYRFFVEESFLRGVLLPVIL